MPTASKSIHKDKLVELYIKDKLSCDAVGRQLGCNRVTILNYLKKYQIPRRSKLGNRKPIKISKEELINFYIKCKMTQKQIAKKIGHSVYGVERWMKIYRIKGRSYYDSHQVHPKFDFGGNLTEKAYLIGFRLGDLNVYKVNNLIQVRCSSTIQNQITLISSLFKNYGYIHTWKNKRGTFEIIVLLNLSFGFLLPKEDKIEAWILENDQYFLSFLGGYSDAEGSFFLRKPYYKNAMYPFAAFEIQAYDKNIIVSISNKLSQLGIENKFYLSKKEGFIDRRGIPCNKDVWKVTIVKRQPLWDFIKLTKSYHQHQSRLQCLAKVEENLLKRNLTKRYQKIDL